MYLVTIGAKERHKNDNMSPYLGAACTIGNKVYTVTNKIGPDLNATPEGARESLRGKEFPYEDYKLKVMSVQEYLKDVGDYQGAQWLNDMREAEGPRSPAVTEDPPSILDSMWAYDPNTDEVPF